LQIQAGKDSFLNMSEINYPEITLKSGREAALRRGHPWLFSGSVASIKGKPDAGDIVLITDSRRQPLALGFFNPRTDISLRVITGNCGSTIAADFWIERIRSAIALRQKIINTRTNAYRLINAEGDGFPGLIVDVYGTTFVISITTAGMEKQRKHIISALIEILNPTRIYEQSAGRSRTLEGLEEARGFICGNDQEVMVQIVENGHKFAVDFVDGQKTGFFLDQRVNREKIGTLACNSRVLNCFSYTGAFSVYCCAGGAKKVVSVDISRQACLAAANHLRENGFSPDEHPVIDADAFTYLRNLQESYDLIILDPPAFAKAKRDVTGAQRGYKEINMQAVRNLAPGGMLATFSCSNFIEEDLFHKIVLGAALDVRADLQLLARLEAGPDHPLSLGHPEGRYLKGLLLRKNN
jgi:23S rRNA (cytosine1962-C5)-methyltransferase